VSTKKRAARQIFLGASGPLGADVNEVLAVWPFVWNLEGPAQADGVLTHCTSQSGCVVGNVSGASTPASVTKSVVLNASTEHFILDIGEANAIPNPGSFRAEMLCKITGVSATFSIIQMFVNNPVSNYGRLDISHNLGVGDMHDWNSGTGGTGTARGKESVSWAYGSPLGGWCAHQMEVNFATNLFKSRILGRAAPNTGTQDSGWKTRAFSPAIAESPFRYLRFHAYTSISANAEVGQFWIGDIDDSFPDGALLTNNFTP
jgi:hypothetical protein